MVENHNVPATRGELRKFSKERSLEDRARTAQEILEFRRAYFDRRENISAQIGGLEQEALEKKMSSEAAAEEVRRIDSEVAARRTSRINELLHLFELKQLQQELVGKREASQELLEEYGTASDTLRSARVSLADRKELEDARERLTMFYAGQEKQWEDYLEDERSRDIRTVSRDYNVVFVHGISNQPLNRNTMLYSAANWETKLKILLALEPTISTSTIEAGDSDSAMWSRCGAILNGGRVASASRADMESIATGIHGRAEGFGASVDAHNMIRSAIKDRKSSSYNEFSVENPKIAGLYYEVNGGTQPAVASLEEMRRFAQNVGLSLYFIKEGEVVGVATASPESGADGEVTTEKILKSPSGISEETRQRLFSEIMEDSPFKIKSPEVEFVESMADGRAEYINVNWKQNPDRFTVTGEDMRTANNSDPAAASPLTTPVRVIARINGAYSHRVYFDDDGQLMVSEINKHLAARGGINGSAQNAFPYKLRLSPGYVRIGLDQLDFGRPLTSNEDYLSGAQDEFIKRKKIIDDPHQREQYRMNCKEYMNRLAFHLRGYAEEAAARGDVETARRATELARQVVSDKTFEEIIARRVGPDGKFRITPEDLEQRF